MNVYHLCMTRELNCPFDQSQERCSLGVPVIYRIGCSIEKQYIDWRKAWGFGGGNLERREKEWFRTGDWRVSVHKLQVSICLIRHVYTFHWFKQTWVSRLNIPGRDRVLLSCMRTAFTCATSMTIDWSCTNCRRLYDDFWTSLIYRVAHKSRITL